jgi:hypothetical protein
VFERVVGALVCAVRGETQSPDGVSSKLSDEWLHATATAAAGTTAAGRRPPGGAV